MLKIKNFDSNDFLHHILCCIDLPVACWSLSGELLYTSESFLKFFACTTPECFLNKIDTFSPERQPNGLLSVSGKQAHLRRAASKGDHNYVWTHILPEIGEAIVSYQLKRIEYKGELLIVAYISDAKDLLSAFEEKFTAEKKAKVIMDASPIGMLVWDNNLQIADCNDVMLQLLKAPSKEFFIENTSLYTTDMNEDKKDGVSYRTLISYEVLQKAFVSNTGKCDLMLQTHDAELLPVHITLKSVQLDNKDVVLGYVEDLRELIASQKQAAEAVEYIEIMLDTISLGANIWNKDLENIASNRAAAELFDLSGPEEYLVRFFELSPEFQPDGQPSKQKAYAKIREAFENGENKFEWLHQKLNGEPIPCEITLFRKQYRGEDVVIGYTHDLRKLKASQKEAAEAVEYIEIMLDTISLGANIWNKDLENIASNRAAADLFDLSGPEEYLERFFELSPEFQPDGQQSKQKAYAKIREAFENGENKFEWLHQKLNGEPIPCEITLFRKQYRGDDVVIGYTHDLRKLKASQKEVAEAAEYIAIVLDTISIGANMWNKDLEIIGANRAAADLFDLSRPEEYSEKFFDLSPEFQPDGQPSKQKAYANIKEAFINGDNKFEWLHQKLNGELIPCEIILIRKRYRGEDVVIGYTHDLRKLKASQKEAAEAAEYIEIMLDTISLGANIWNKDLENIASNRAAAELFDLSSPDEYLEKFFELSPEFQPDGQPSKQKAHACINEAFANGENKFEWLHQKLNGDPVPCEVTLIRKKYRGEDIVVGYTKDLRDLKASQQETSDSNELREAILNTMPVAVAFWSKDYEMFDCNVEAVKLFNASSKESVLLHYKELIPVAQPDATLSDARIKDIIHETFEKGYMRFEWLFNDMDGKPLPVEITIVKSTYYGEDIAVAYMRDLRELKTMLQEINDVGEDLRKAKDAAEQSTRAKSEFLANMSHEIRTPMNGILGLLHLLSMTNLENDQRGYIDKTLFSANNLLRIVNDILDFSKIEAGKLEMEIAPFTLVQVCKEVKDLYAERIKAKGLEYIVSTCDASTGYILGDSLRLKQILFNLVSNAIKFTHQGHIKLSITVSERSDNQIKCLFVVSDTGIGLSIHQLKKIFSAFSQADTSITRKYGGTGLGLAISRNLAQMMQGDLWAESVEDEGTSFYFTAVFDLCHDCNEVDKDKFANKTFTRYPGHLLLVEDNEINQLIAMELLQNMGYTVDTADNGQEALDILQQKKYDLVLMDIQMPIMDGLTASMKIREQSVFNALPIVAMSAHAMSGDKEISLSHGMNDHITKPIVPEVLNSTIQYWLSIKNNLK